MKKILLPGIFFFVSIVVSTLIWEHINLSVNDIVKFIFFLSIPFLTLIFFYQSKEKKFFRNLKNVIFFDKNDNLSSEFKNIKILNFYTYFILLFLLIEFFSVNFSNLNHNIDMFHEGMWLTASQNLKTTGGYWSSSYVVRGFFGDFYPYFLWNFFGVESIGITRFFYLVFILFNKILLILIARKLSLIVYLRNENYIYYFLFLSAVFLFFQSYGNHLFILRSFLILLFALVLLNFLSNRKTNHIHCLIIGFFSSISFFWYIDIGIYINTLIFILVLFLIIRFEFKSLISLILGTLTGWVIFYLSIPKLEFLEFIKNSFLIISTLNDIHSITFPTPFISMDARSTKAMILFLITGFLIIYAINNLEEKNNKIYLTSIIFLFLISCLYFSYGLSRSDSPHIRVATGFIYIPFLSMIFYLILRKINFDAKKKFEVFKYSKKIILSLIILSIFIDKKYEDKKVIYIKDSFSEIQKLIKYDDNSFLRNDYKEFLDYYQDLSKNDDCITIFTNEVAIYYFLKKPSCSKYYFMWTASPKEIQLQMIEDIREKKPTYILYKSDKDLFYDSDKSLLNINTFIKKSYIFYEKFKNWEIYKKKL